jgi:hypothetical protein
VEKRINSPDFNGERRIQLSMRLANSGDAKCPLVYGNGDLR